VHGTTLTSIVHQHINNARYADFFNTPYEKLLIAHAAPIILEPMPLVEHTQLFYEALEFIIHAQRQG